MCVMEPKISLQCSQKPAVRPCPEPVESNVSYILRIGFPSCRKHFPNLSAVNFIMNMILILICWNLDIILTFFSAYGFQSWQRLRIFLFTIVSSPALGPTQAPIQCVTKPLSLRVNLPGCEAGHSRPSSAVKNAWSYTSAPPIRFHDVVLS
jgi:hypothetical protein